VENESVTNGHLFYIIIRSTEERTRLIQHLRRKGILAVFHYVPLHSSPAGMKYGRPAGDLSVTEDISGRLLRLPLYYEMKDEDVDTVIDAVKQFYRMG
jgi:dTDP-4-amino-4,6-dideoxygalactose transaminase